MVESWSPDKLVDLLADGRLYRQYSGAPGIGSKGAVQIIQQFGSIEAALAGWESVRHKTYRESAR
jgi:DNA polymerase-1